jgi:hypothetical protein
MVCKAYTCGTASVGYSLECTTNWKITTMCTIPLPSFMDPDLTLLPMPTLSSLSFDTRTIQVVPLAFTNHNAE